MKVVKIISFGKKGGRKTVEVITKDGFTRHLRHAKKNLYEDEDGKIYKV